MHPEKSLFAKLLPTVLEMQERDDGRGGKRGEGGSIQINNLSGRYVLGNLTGEAVVLQVDLLDIGVVGEVGKLANKAISKEIPITK